MNEPNAQPGAEDKAVGPETPEDVAILYSWANLHGAKYRDFSASRREFRAQQRARVAEQQRQTELAAARVLEQAAQRELEEAQRLLDGTPFVEAAAVADAEAKLKAEEAIRRAEERAQQETLEAQRREQSAEELRVLAEKARSEMLEARKRAEDQAARYAEFDAHVRAEVTIRPPATVPGELADPYYYTGQVDPAYFASTPGVRTAQAARVSTERKAYQFPLHTGSEEHDSGTVRVYRPSTTFAPSPVSDHRSASFPVDMLVREQDREQDHPNGRFTSTVYAERTPPLTPDNYYDGGESTRAFLPVRSGSSLPSSRNTAPRDLHIRPMARRALIDDVPYEEPLPVRSFAPTPLRRPSAPGGPPPPVMAESDLPIRLRKEEIEAGQGQIGAEPNAPSTPSFLQPAAAATDGKPVIETTGQQRTVVELTPDETHWRSMDRRSRSLRRRRDSIDKRARTTRQPRPESPLPDEPSADSDENLDRQVPPAWFVPSDLSGTEVSVNEQSNRELGEKAPILPSAFPESTETPPSSANPVPRFRNVSDVAGHDMAGHQVAGPLAAVSAAGPDVHAYREGLQRVHAVVPELRLRDATPSLFLRNGQLPAERYQELDMLPTDSVTPGLTGPAQEEPSLPLDVVETNGIESQADLITYTPLAPDTLQQSRERVASRWFALKDLMGAPASDQAVLANSYDTKSPALSVISLSGGVGKTSIVATIGRALSSLGEKVLLADANTHGLLPYYFGARDLRPGTVRTFTPPQGSVDAPVLLVNYEAEGLSGDEAEQTRILEDIDRRAEGTQRVLLDLNSSNLWLAKRMARLNPWVLVPIAPDMNSVLGTHTVERLFADVTDASGRPVKPFYVLNQFDPTLPLHLDVREVLRQFLGDRLLPIMIHRAHAVAEALAEGMTVIDYAPGSPVADEYMKLAAWLRKLSAPIPSHVHGARWSER